MAFAKRIRSTKKDDESRIRLAFRTSLSRDPDAEELKRFLGYAQSGGDDPWLSLATVLLNLDETLTRE